MSVSEFFEGFLYQFVGSVTNLDGQGRADRKTNRENPQGRRNIENYTKERVASNATILKLSVTCTYIYIYKYLTLHKY